MKKCLVIIAARGIGDLIYHLPLLRSLHESHKKKLIIISNQVNQAKEVYKNENFYEKIFYFDNTRFSLFKTLKAIKDLTNLINDCNVDQLILTASSRRLMIPVYMAKVKEKIIFGGGDFILTKNKKYDHLIHAEKIMKYTEDLNLPIKRKDFFLKKTDFNKTEESNYKSKVFIGLDSHHDQNNWRTKNYIEIIKKILAYDIKIFINFSPNKSYFMKILPKEFVTSKKISFTCKKKISEIIEIINSCNYVVGNESGPICLAASLDKEVHSIYIPVHTQPESKIINNKTIYYNTEKENAETIIKKITNSILSKK